MERALHIAERICNGQIVHINGNNYALETVFARCRQSAAYQTADQILDADESSEAARNLAHHTQKQIWDRCLMEVASEAAGQQLPAMLMEQAA